MFDCNCEIFFSFLEVGYVKYLTNFTYICGFRQAYDKLDTIVANMSVICRQYVSNILHVLRAKPYFRLLRVSLPA